MTDYIITCSSTCDLTKEYLQKHNNPYVKFSFLLCDKNYSDDFYDNISIKEFYEKIKTEDIKTSQPDSAQYEEMWESVLKEGKDVLHIELSSGITGAYTGSLIVKDMLLEKYPDRKIVVIDSLCCSSGYGYLLMLANEKKESGLSIEEMEKYVEDMKRKIHHVFVPNIEQLIKGGRISAPIGMIAKAINIVPILHVNEEGKLEMLSKARGQSKALSEIKSYISSHIDDGENYNGKFVFEHIDARDALSTLYNDIKETYKNATIDDKDIYNMGSVIGAHAGAGTFAVFFVGDERA